MHNKIDKSRNSWMLIVFPFLQPINISPERDLQIYGRWSFIPHTLFAPAFQILFFFSFMPMLAACKINLQLNLIFAWYIRLPISERNLCLTESH